jgi:phage terminase small subunit
VVVVDVREQAKQLYEQGYKLKDIAEQLNVNGNTLRSWKNRDKWVVKSATKKCNKNKSVATNKVLHNDAVNETYELSETLTEKQKLFCLYYIKNFNASMAAVKAGYSENSAGEQGYQLLQKTSIREEINRLKELRKRSIMINEDDIVERYMQIAFADLTDFVEFGQDFVPVTIKDKALRDKDGNIIFKGINSIRLKDSNVVDGGLICEVSTSRQGTKIKLEDRQKALDWLANYFGMNPEHKYRMEYDSKKLQIELEKLGAIVYLTREGDYDLAVPNTINRKRSDLSRRGNLINKSECDLYLSIHLNAETSSTWRGGQVFYDDINEKNQLLAKKIQDEFRKSLYSRRKIKEITDMYLSKRVKVPGVLLEIGYISNPNDRYLLKQDSYQSKVSKTIVNALIKYFDEV